MQISTELLIDELLQIPTSATQSAQQLKTLSTNELNYKTSPTQWSILECIEHLNLYGDFYLPAIEKAILNNPVRVNKPVFKSGIIGNYFVNLIQVKNGSIKKMKSPKDKNPINSVLTITTIDRFLKQQLLLSSLLVQAKKVDLTHIKVPISITPLIKLRLGDTFRFFVYHIQRHIVQAERIAYTKEDYKTEVDDIIAGNHPR